MSYDERLGDYNDVASRMREFFEKHPEGRLRPASPWRIETVGDKAFVVYEAAAYRTDGDPLPGIGTAWEPFPGRTPYTKDSELMNAETSAWGRAILAVGAADTKKGVASHEEVRNRQADRQQQWEDAKPAQPPAQPARPAPDTRLKILANAEAAIDAAPVGGLAAIEERVAQYVNRGSLTPGDGVALGRRVKARMELLAANRAASLPAEDRTAEPEQTDLGGDWPEARKPGTGDPA